MQTVHADRLVDDYVKDLDSELRRLPDNRRREILEEVRQHISEARAALEAETEANVRTVLELLGDPAEIATEAKKRFGVVDKPGTPLLEIATVVLMIIPFVGWAVSTVLLWMSNLWTRRDKIIGTIGALAFLPVGAIGVASIRPEVQGPLAVEDAGPGIDASTVGSLVSDSPVDGDVGLLELWMIFIILAIPIATAIYLGMRLRALRQSGPAIP